MLQKQVVETGYGNMQKQVVETQVVETGCRNRLWRQVVETVCGNDKVARTRDSCRRSGGCNVYQSKAINQKLRLLPEDDAPHLLYMTSALYVVHQLPHSWTYATCEKTRLYYNILHYLWLLIPVLQMPSVTFLFSDKNVNTRDYNFEMLQNISGQFKR